MRYLRFWVDKEVEGALGTERVGDSAYPTPFQGWVLLNLCVGVASRSERVEDSANHTRMLSCLVDKIAYRLRVTTRRG